MYQFYRHVTKPAFVLITAVDAKLPSETKAEDWKKTQVRNEAFGEAKRSIEEKGYYLMKLGVTFREVDGG